MALPIALDDLNRMDANAFTAALAQVFEHAPWVAARAAAKRPFASRAALHDAMKDAVSAASDAEQMALIRGHPELAGKAAVRRELTVDSSNEQSGAGLTQCSPEEFALLTDLNRRYHAKFGFPFILAVKGHDRASVIREFARRVEQDRVAEFAECLAQIARITRFRLEALVTG